MGITTENKMNLLGQLGENITAQYFQNEGFIVESSVSVFDRKKDMQLKSKTGEVWNVEVKTQQPYHMKNSFTVLQNQVKKCKEVDILIFVETPSHQSNKRVKIWHSPKDKREFTTTQTSDGRDMYMLNKSDMRLLSIIDDTRIISEMQMLSLSKWKGDKNE